MHVFLLHACIVSTGPSNQLSSGFVSNTTHINSYTPWSALTSVFIDQIVTLLRRIFMFLEYHYIYFVDTLCIDSDICSSPT